jgi:hypothetical protein
MWNRVVEHWSQLQLGTKGQNLKLCLKTIAQCYGLYVLAVIIIGFCFGIWQGLIISGWI